MTKITRRRMMTGTAGLLAAAGVLGGTRLAWASADGDVLRVATAKPEGDLNPHIYAGLFGAQALIFEPLVRYGHGGVVEPALASAWELAEEGRVLKLDLRDGVVFHDGTPWNADAMKWNLDRWIGKSKQGWLNVSRLFEDLVVRDPLKVEMHFREPVPGLFSELSFVRPVRFLSPASVGPDGEYSKPVGTGPWRQMETGSAQSVYERFEDYWGEKPSFERLELKVLPDSRSRMAAIRAGDIDITGGEFLAPITANEAVTLQAAGVAVDVKVGTNTFLIGFNPDRAPALKDIRVRRAISLGLDRAGMTQVLYRGLATPANSLFSAEVPHAGSEAAIPVRDTARAMALLEEAGWTGDGIRSKDGQPLSLELIVSEEQVPGSRSLSESVQAQLREIGIDVRVRSVDHASRHSDVPARNYDLAFFLTYGAPYDPYGTLVTYFLSTHDSGVDGKIYVDAENLDPLLHAVMSSTEDEMDAAVGQVIDWLDEQQAIVPLYFVPHIWAHSDRIAGFEAPPTEYEIPFRGLKAME